ncbi:hypothetical protein [Nocardia sp. BMG51109]|uniref:hypothetical protein n=1 Tax=Nocardia sp. BMG51109 TaxID=1056816 RepID=UPI0012EC2A50|nr:hypothetical protein [Nocardia sp. BMG51109]
MTACSVLKPVRELYHVIVPIDADISRCPDTAVSTSRHPTCMEVVAMATVTTTAARTSRPVNAPVAQDLLPSPEAVLEAVRGTGDMSPVTDAIQRMGILYRELLIELDSAPRAGEAIRARIGAVAGEIDSWVSGQLPRPHPAAFRLTDTVGGVISRLVEAWEAAWWALHHCDHPTADPRVHRTWDHLAEMREGYDQFITRVLAGDVELPKAWPGIEAIEGDLER